MKGKNNEKNHEVREQNIRGKAWKVNLAPTVGSTSDSRARGPWFDFWSGHILSFLPLIQEVQMSVTGESMCVKYWLSTWMSKPAQEKCG